MFKMKVFYHGLQFDCQFGKTMENKTPIIHQLKGKSRLNPQSTTLAHKNSKELLQVSQNIPQISYQTSKPILIRYIDPRLVPIFKELNTLTSKCEQIATQSKESPQVTQQEKIQELLQSTKKINDQFNEIIEKSEQITTQHFKVQCPSITLQGQSSEAQKVSIEKDDFSKQAEEQQLQPIYIVNKVSEKLDQLELQNATLRKELQKEKKRNIDVELQNKELKEKLSKFQRQRKEILVNIRLELDRLKDDKGLLELSKFNLNTAQ